MAFYIFFSFVLLLSLFVCLPLSFSHAHADDRAVAKDPRCRMDVKGFVFCQQRNSTSHDNPVGSRREDGAKKVEDKKRKTTQ